VSLHAFYRYLFDDKYAIEVIQHSRPSQLEFTLVMNKSNNYLFSEYHVVVQFEERYIHFF
jgi:hypothetical protein